MVTVVHMKGTIKMFSNKMLLAAVLSFASTGAASACEGWGCEWAAFGDADAGGMSVVGFDADFSNNSSVSFINTNVYTNSGPYADADAVVYQSTEGQAASHNFLEGGIYQAGSTSVYADDGDWYPQSAGTSTYGQGELMSYAYGDDSITMSNLYASSTQGSSVSDGWYYGGADASAEQAVGGTVVSAAEGSGSVATGGFIHVSGTAEAYSDSGYDYYD